MDFKDFEKSGVYKIINLVNDKVYIGSTIMSFNKRFSYHLNRLRNGRHKNKHLQHAWDKYGEESFNFEIADILVGEKECREEEQYYLDICDGNCYNINMSSSTPPLTDKIRKIRSETAKRNCENKSNGFGFEKGNVPWNKNVTSDDYDYSYLKVPKTITNDVLESRKLRSEHIRSKVLPKVEVFDMDGRSLGVWRSAIDLQEDSLNSNFKLKDLVKPKKRTKSKVLKSKDINMCCKGLKDNYKNLKFKFV